MKLSDFIISLKHKKTTQHNGIKLIDCLVYSILTTKDVYSMEEME